MPSEYVRAARLSPSSSGATPASAPPGTSRSLCPCIEIIRLSPRRSRTVSSAPSELMGTVRVGSSGSTSVMRKTPAHQCAYGECSRMKDGMPCIWDMSSAEKVACDAIMQPGAMSAPSSGPVKDSMSSSRVGGSHVNNPLHTLQR